MDDDDIVHEKLENFRTIQRVTIVWWCSVAVISAMVLVIFPVYRVYAQDMLLFHAYLLGAYGFLLTTIGFAICCIDYLKTLKQDMRDLSGHRHFDAEINGNITVMWVALTTPLIAGSMLTALSW